MGISCAYTGHMETTNTYNITSNDIARAMNEWDNQIKIAMDNGNTRNEAIVLVTAMFIDFFVNYAKYANPTQPSNK